MISRDGPGRTLRAQQGAPGAADRLWTDFEAEVLPHVDRLFRLAMWFERNRAEAEDLVQDTMMQALQSFHRFQPGTNCRAWLTTILHHVRSNRRRARSRSRLVDDLDDRIGETVAFVPPVPERLTDEEILGALARIPALFQDVILLCDVEELTYKEAAAALAIPRGTVMSRLHRGRALLRAELAASTGGLDRRRVEGRDNHDMP
jgi:RNA polymerase sigma-70 factor (ECF subfamily)